MKEAHMAAALETATKELHRQIGLSTDGNQFLMDILRVQEIKGYTAVTKIPNTPPHIKGVLNLRGTIVPIIDLRAKFGMPTIDYTAFTVIIVVVVRDKVMGIVVDAVSDVLNIDKKDIQPPPEFGARVDVSFLNGIGKSGDKLVAVLDIDRLLADGAVQDAAAAAEV
jgi:purine-binding chemotaxis protein CheW